MATNKQLVEQAVAAIPLWRAFLDQKEAEQNLILQQMQDDETQFAPKSFTQRLTDRFRSTPAQPPQTSDHTDDDLIVQDQNKLEQEAREEVKIEEEQDVVKETKVTEKQKPASSNDDDKRQISNENFKDIF